MIDPIDCVSHKAARIQAMSERNSDNLETIENDTGPVIFVHAGDSGAPAKEWLEKLLALGMPVFSHGDYDGCSKTKKNYAQLGPLLRELAKKAPSSPVLMISSGFEINSRLLTEIASTTASENRAVARTVLSNAIPDFNPFAGLKGNQNLAVEHLDGLFGLLGPGMEHEHFNWPGHFVALSSSAVSALTGPEVNRASALACLQEAGGSLSLSDLQFAHAPGKPLFNAIRLQPHESRRPPSWGGLSARLQDWLDSGCPEIGRTSDPEKPVTLHVTHSWGGGVALWTSTFASFDQDSNHLQLRSEGAQSGHGPGQRLCLYASNQLDCPIGSWWLQPPIQSIQSANAHYRQVLDEICRRYGVGRIIISSLVGHSLDVLYTGLPTVQVLHDHFPVWPLLSANPCSYVDSEGNPDLAKALEDPRLKIEFSDRSTGSWLSLREQYLTGIKQNKIKVAAPSQSVIDLQRSLDPGWAELQIELIPHGFPPMVAETPVPVKPRADERLRLVILGRIQTGKGQKLVLEALPGLQAIAQVYLIGTGKNGEAFFGLPGVNVILDYQREDLPSLLTEIGPDVAALLSLVPETFSYALSELHYLGIPVIATHVGSFPGRIEDGKNGWLIEPAAQALSELVSRLHKDRSGLKKVRKTLVKQDVIDPVDMIKAYSVLCKPVSVQSTPASTKASLAQVQASAFAYQDTGERVARYKAEEEARELGKEIRKRTDWVLDSQRELKEEQKRRKHWVALLQEEIRHHFSTVTSLSQELASRKHWVALLQEEIRHHISTVTSLSQELASRKHWVALLQEEIRHHISTVTSLSQELASRKHWVALLQEEIRHHISTVTSRSQELADTRNLLEQRDQQLQQTVEDLEQLQRVHEQVLASSSWRITRPFRVLRRTGQNFMLNHAWNPLRWPLLLSALVRNLSTVDLHGTLMRLQFGGYQEPPDSFPVDAVESIGDPNPPSSVPNSDSPVISIVIPAYNNWLYTAACLRSIAETHNTQHIEVILVDDESSDETELKASKIKDLKYLRNTENLGFIGSCNHGAEQASGKYLVFLNNDTQVTAGWLDNLLDVFFQFPDTGLVGSRLVYPDGSLQECGGIIFSDGSGWNYGRDDNPERPEYMHIREVDYCSGACIMTESALFRELGGFCEDYKPAYYEDTDLAFRTRASGRKVMVQPASTVIHHEGITSGTDTGGGIKKYQLVNQEKFVRNWESELASYPERIDDPTNPAVIRTARDHRLRGRVLIIDATTPEPDQDSGSLRLTHVMRCFRGLGYGVTFFADNHQHAGRYTRELQQWGVEVVYEPWLESNQAFFRQRGSEFDFVMVSRHYIAANYLSMVKRFCPNAKFIFDTVDLHYLREQRLAELEDSLALRQVAGQTRRSELAVIEQADAILVVSETEVGVLKEDAPGAMVHVLSNIHEVPGRRPGFEERSDLFFVGGYQHPPNVDAARWFVNSIWPLIHARLPEARFHLIGSKAPESVSELKGDGVIFHGFIEDLEHYLDHCRLAVAPLRYGAGVKGKVNLSMSHGQPVVATPMAVEGIHAEHGREVLVAESEQDFANEVIRLYRDETLWNKISDAAIQNVESHFSVKAARASLESLVEKLNSRNQA